MHLIMLTTGYHKNFIYLLCMHSKFLYIYFMSLRTLEQELRYTWLSISKMYNEEASKYGGSMAVGFALLSLNPKQDTP